MVDYEPLSLTSSYNAGTGDLPDTAQREHLELGAVALRGLPFLIGGETPEPERCMVIPREPRTIPVGRTARRIIVAHRQLEPTSVAGHGIGTVVATYTIRLAGGERFEIPIRERFEIQVVPHQWGSGAFLALTDHYDGNMPRFEGRWDSAGFRLSEHGRGWPRAWYLWTWENPQPDKAIEAIDVRPGASPIAIGGITLGHADEHPFVREAARPVRLTVTDPAVADADAVLDLDVDRGVATYPQPLPGGADRPAWGAVDVPGRPPTPSPSYANVAAIPSATLDVGCKGERLGSVRWSDVERHGRAESDRIRVELVEEGRNWVHVEVLDDQTGRPVPCRVNFRSPAGIPYQPHGHHNHVAQNLNSWHWDVGGDVRLGELTYAYIDGTCQGWLPRGEVIVDIARGFEYEPLRQTVRIEPGRRELSLRIRRTADMAARGWWDGDSHVHFLSTAGAQLEQRGEDLRVVNLLQAQWGALFTNTEDFTGRPSLIDGGDYVTYVGQENRQHLLGHMVLWGLTEPIMPWSSDGPDEAELGGALDATMSDWADRAHAQGGTVVSAHFPNPNGEPAALVATGRTDAVEMLTQNDDTMLEYYLYLNAGYRLPLVGGTDKMSSSVPVGLHRTYARIVDEEPGYDAWRRAVAAGRTFLSAGPLLSFTVDGHEVGDTIELSGPGTVHVQASVTSIFPLRSLEIVRNGEVVAVAEASGSSGSSGGAGTFSLALQEDVRIDGHAWLVCRAFGTDHHFDEWARGVFAHTSPVYVACGGPWAMADPAALRYIRTVVEGARAYVRNTAPRRDDRRTTHHHGQADHLGWLERPFDEAIRALDERLRRS